MNSPICPGSSSMTLMKVTSRRWRVVNLLTFRFQFFWEMYMQLESREMLWSWSRLVRYFMLVHSSLRCPKSQEVSQDFPGWWAELLRMLLQVCFHWPSKISIENGPFRGRVCIILLLVAAGIVASAWLLEFSSAAPGCDFGGTSCVNISPPRSCRAASRDKHWRAIADGMYIGAEKSSHSYSLPSFLKFVDSLTNWHELHTHLPQPTERSPYKNGEEGTLSYIPCSRASLLIIFVTPLSGRNLVLAGGHFWGVSVSIEEVIKRAAGKHRAGRYRPGCSTIRQSAKRTFCFWFRASEKKELHHDGAVQPLRLTQPCLDDRLIDLFKDG